MEFSRGWMRRLLPWVLLAAFSLTLHLWRLDERSFHHDEAIHAQSAYQLLKSGNYHYDPVYHGPLLYYLTAATFAVAGDSDFTARLPVALCGVLLVAIAWAVRRPLGGRAAWWTGLLATLSPICLYYGRFLRMDILEMAVASAAFVALWRAVRGGGRAWVWFGLWTALAFATKENAFVTAALAVAVACALVLLAGVRPAAGRVIDWFVRHRWGVIASIATAIMVSVPLFTVGFRHPGDWFFPYTAIDYWWGQHSIERVAGPPWFHLPRLALYEFLPILAGLAWAIRRGRRMGVVERSLVVFGLFSVGMYAYLGEKVPWLGVHQVWAFLPLAGLQLARTFGPRGVWWSRSLAAVGLAATVLTTLVANFVLDEISPNRPRVEALTYVQTCPEVVAPVREGYALKAEGKDPVAAVGGEVAWPYSWYWRDVPVWWSNPDPGMRPPLVFCDPDEERQVRRGLGPGYSSEKIPLRGWWVMADQKPTIGEVLRYVFTRRPWGVIGSTDTMVLRFTGIEDTGPRDAPVPAPLAEVLGVETAEVLGDGWIGAPRGLSVGAGGKLAVADSTGNDVVFFSADGNILDERLPPGLNQPESVAWTPDGILVVADTWNHRVVLFSPDSKAFRPLPEPEEGWYGPRAVAVAPDGTIAVADTGHKRVILFSFAGGAPRLETIGGEGAGAGQLVEPVGLDWIDNRRLLVCDTGNRRLQVLDRKGRQLSEVALPEAWSDFYSRPQVVALGPERWLATDVPAQGLWLVEDGRARLIDLSGAAITPSGVAHSGNTLYVSDLLSGVWAFHLEE